MKRPVEGTDRGGHRIEWPTLVVVAICYIGFAFSTAILPGYSLVAAVVLLALVLALHSSLQHEVLHGHPFSLQWVNVLLVFPALGLFIPYERFRDTHLAHHYDPNLTDPYDDPESNYLDPATWARCCSAFRAVLRFNNTLLGRMLVGPLIGTALFWNGDSGRMRRGEGAVLRAYAMHALGVALVAGWLALYGGMPVWAYLVAAYGGLSLLKIRTFLEHRAHDSVPGRSVVIEDRGMLAFLFLNNNFHAVHHAHPRLPWYALPAAYAARRERVLARNRGYRYASYGEVLRRYFLRAKDPVPHPLRSPATGAAPGSD